MFDESDKKMCCEHEYVLKHWDDGKLETFSSVDELYEKYKYLLKKDEGCDKKMKESLKLYIFEDRMDTIYFSIDDVVGATKYFAKRTEENQGYLALGVEQKGKSISDTGNVDLVSMLKDEKVPYYSKDRLRSKMFKNNTFINIELIVSIKEHIYKQIG